MGGWREGALFNHLGIGRGEGNYWGLLSYQRVPVISGILGWLARRDILLHKGGRR